MATLRGEPVDRPPVSFYELGGFQIDPADADPYGCALSPLTLRNYQTMLELAGA